MNGQPVLSLAACRNPKSRLLVNIDRLHRFMDEHDLSAVIARSGVNFTYLSGVAYDAHWGLPAATGMMLVPRNLSV